MFQEAYMRKIVAVFGIVASLALVAYAYSVLQQTRYMYHGPTTISVTGTGEAFAKPDVATFSFTLNAKEADAVTAQNKISKSMDDILAYLKGAGVEEKDVKTEYYNLSPWYEYASQDACPMGWCPPSYNEPKLKGFEANQSVTVKVRDIAKAGEIISQIGSKGAQDVSSIQMTIDDTSALEDEARKKAIEDAQKKAKTLAEDLGVHLVRMNGYWEEGAPGYQQYGMGMGGDNRMMAADAAMTPKAANLPAGENTITSQVNLSYEIR